MGEDQVQLPPECYGYLRHLEEGEDPSPTPPRTQWKPPTAEEGEDQVQLRIECYGDHLEAKQGEDQVQLTPEHHGGHLNAEEGDDQVQLIPGRHDGHLHAEDDKGRPSWKGVEARALRNFACSF